MKDLNHVVLVGPVSNVDIRMFSSYGFLSMRVLMSKVSVVLDPKQNEWAHEFQQARCVALWDGFFDSRADKKDPGKWWYEIGARASSVRAVSTELTPVNRAEVVGKVQRISNEWVTLSCSYFAPKKKTWLSRILHVRSQQTLPNSLYGKRILAIGTVAPKLNGTPGLHLAATQIHQL